MKIAVINLERSVERRARMTILLQRFGLDFSFSQAVDAAEAVVVDIDPRPAVVAQADALAPDAPLLFPDNKSNVCFAWIVSNRSR